MVELIAVQVSALLFPSALQVSLCESQKKDEALISYSLANKEEQIGASVCSRTEADV